MKKYLALVLGVLFTLGFAVSAFAITSDIPTGTQAAVASGTTQITLGGELRFQGEFRENMADFKDTVSDAADYSKYDGRVKLKLTAVVSKNVTGFVQLESQGFLTSATNNSGGWNWGYPSSDAGIAGIYAEGNAKRGPLAILEAWIQYKFNLGAPASLKVGHMPIKLGNGLYFNHGYTGDDAIVLALDPMPVLHFELIDAKLNEGVDNYTSRVCVNNTTGAITTTTGAACATGTTQLATNSTSQTGVASAAQSGQGSPNDSDLYAAVVAFKGTGFNLGSNISYLLDQDYSAKGLHLFNAGFNATTTVGPVGLLADVEVQRGTAKADPGGTDIKYKGYAYLLGANFTVGAVKLDAGYAVGSGDSNASDNKINTFVTAGAGTVGIPTAPYVFGGKTKGTGVTAPSTGATTGSASRGLSNLTYYKAGITASPTKDLTVSANYYLLRATKAVSTNPTYNSKKIGSELDAKLTYTLEKNLVYSLEGGYLFAGDFFKNLTAGADPDNAWGVIHGLTLSF